MFLLFSIELYELFQTNAKEILVEHLINCSIYSALNEIWKCDYKQIGSSVWGRDQSILSPTAFIYCWRDMRGSKWISICLADWRKLWKTKGLRIGFKLCTSQMQSIMYPREVSRCEMIHFWVGNTYAVYSITTNFKLAARIYAWKWDQTTNHNGIFHISKSEV
jgi:hypothetical protein